MYKNDCKTIRLQIDESNLGQELNLKIMEHLRQCDSCHGFYESELKLRKLVAGLPQVEAPADFEFRLRARIAKDRAKSSFSFGSLGVPFLAAAALILLVSGILVVRNVMPSKQSSQVASGSTNGPAGKSMVDHNSEPTQALQSKAPNVKTSQTYNDPGPRSQPETKHFVAVSKDRIVSRDSSSVGATVVRQDTALAGAQLPLIFPVQTLSVSVDDGTGVARTISFPTVSFGSERILTREGNSFKGAGKSDW